MTDKIVVLTTCDSEEAATKLARGLVEGQLAACVNIVSGVRSIYRWQGEMQDDAEWMLVIKSRRDRLSELKAAIDSLHTYEVPEGIALPIVDGSERYLRWLDDELGPGPDDVAES